MSSYKKLVTLTFCAKCSELQCVRETLRTALFKKNLPGDFIEEVVLAVDEACANVVTHAHNNDDKYTGDIILEIFHNEDEIRITLTDFADPVDTSKIKSRELDEVRPGGLGIHFMNELMDEIRYLEIKSGIGNILEMKKRLPKTKQEK
jgi:anti-sigma regulatory factor (Ser/Thr protein kinase)